MAQLTTTVQPMEIRNTPPFEDESLIVGRDGDITFLVETVCTNHEDLPVIAFMGMGGLGKTTLACMVYNRDVVTDMFTKRIVYEPVLEYIACCQKSDHWQYGNEPKLINTRQKNSNCH